MIKMLVMDLDDTLLDIQKKIPLRALDYLNKVSQKGVSVVLATGRIYPSARILAEQIQSDNPIICYNGSLIRTISGTTIYEKYVDLEVIRDMAEYCKNNNLYLQLYYNDKIVVDHRCAELDIDPDSLVTECITVGDLTLADLHPSHKMMIVNDPVKIPEIQKELESLFYGKLYFATSKDYLLEMMPPAVNKSASLKILCDIYNIKPSEVLACGDNTNDAEMVKWAGVGVAVQNAVPSLKEVANYVSPFERSDGVIDAIKTYIL